MVLQYLYISKNRIRLFIAGIFFFSILSSFIPQNSTIQSGNSYIIAKFASNEQQDTCIIEGMTFEMIDNGEIQGLKAIIRNERIRIISSKNDKKEFRVIRYVFSIHQDEKYSSVRHYGDLVSYPVINLLKTSEPGDQFYFEDIIIVDPSKVILNNAVRPIILKKL